MDATPTWIDSHCHLDMAGGARDLVDRARAAGVVRIVDVGTDLATSGDACARAAEFPDVFATVGLHPHEARHFDQQWPRLCELVDRPGVVGLGETGFDLHYGHSPVADQERAFRAHVRMAHERGLALVIHTRDAWDHTFGVLEDEGTPERTVFHCFSGGAAEAERALALGAHLSFSGVVSFKNADDVRAAAALAPRERILVETDSPYLAPVPKRGAPNEPAYVVHVGAALAAARDTLLDDVAAATTANALRVFALPE